VHLFLSDRYKNYHRAPAARRSALSFYNGGSFMNNLTISRTQVKQFVLEVFDILIADVKAWEAKEQEAITTTSSVNEQRYEERRAAA